MSVASFSSSDSPVKPLIHNQFTPPQCDKIKNPFEKALLDNLHRPICSPDMFTLSKKDSNTQQFEWDINEVAILQPANIEDSPAQSDPSPDPTLERKANTVIKKFFSQGVLPSPMDQPARVNYLLKIQGDSAKKYNVILKMEAQTQTALSLPPVLPKDLELLLEPYFAHTRNDSSSEFDNTAVSAYCQYTSAGNGDEFIELERKEPLVQPKNILIHGMDRSFGTPSNSNCTKSKTQALRQYDDAVHQTLDPGFSPILYDTHSNCKSRGSLPDDLSPIKFEVGETMRTVGMIDCNHENNHFCGSTPEKSITVSCHTSLSPVKLKQRGASMNLPVKLQKGESNLNRSKSVMKLDFSMDMSVDTSLISNLDRGHSAIGVQNEYCQSSPLAKQEFWDMDMSSSGNFFAKQSDAAHDGDPDKHKFTIPDNLGAPVERNCKYFRNKSCDDHYAIKDTPVKGKAKNVLLLDKVFERVFQEKKSFHQNSESPMQMSFDNSFDNDNLENLPESNIDLKSASFSTLITSQINIQPCSKLHDTNEISIKNGSSYKRLDSGLGNETYFGKSSYFDNITRQSAELTYSDVTKSHCNVDLTKSSGENWRRIDSGFTEETSSDNFQYCTEEHKVNSILPNQESLSISDIFANGLINCNFSSTPSKSKIRKN